MRLQRFSSEQGLWRGSSWDGHARIYDSSITWQEGEYAGFRPPTDHWIKFGYVVYTGPYQEANSAWRDYNIDGAPDIDGNPYGVSANENIGSANRSTRYADRCEMPKSPDNFADLAAGWTGSRF